MLLNEVWIILTNGHPTAIALSGAIQVLASSETSVLPPGWANARFNGNLDTNKRYHSQGGKWMVLDERGYEYVVEF
jgi:hypothetical protein